MAQKDAEIIVKSDTEVNIVETVQFKIEKLIYAKKTQIAFKKIFKKLVISKNK